MALMGVLGRKLAIAEPFNDKGRDFTGRLEIQRAVSLRHAAEKKHSSVLSASASYGKHPTFMFGTIKSGAGFGSII